MTEAVTTVRAVRVVLEGALRGRTWERIAREHPDRLAAEEVQAIAWATGHPNAGKMRSNLAAFTALPDDHPITYPRPESAVPPRPSREPAPARPAPPRPHPVQPPPAAAAAVEHPDPTPAEPPRAHGAGGSRELLAAVVALQDALAEFARLVADAHLEAPATRSARPKAPSPLPRLPDGRASCPADGCDFAHHHAPAVAAHWRKHHA